MSTATLKKIRPVERIVPGTATSDGMGVKLTRVIGKTALPDLDPFLMLDEFRSDDSADTIGGFPDHPHRGFETVTYMLAGRMRHGDNQGNAGVLLPGGVQWMTAGRGIVHSEMPEPDDGLMWGFQLWVNLPAKDKMTAPRYRDVAPEAVPSVTLDDGVDLRVIAGRAGDTVGPVGSAAADPTYFDVTLREGAAFTFETPTEYAAFVYVFEGEAQVGAEDFAETVKRGEIAVLDPGDAARVAAANGAARFLFVMGRPLGEPVVKYGPFVMNTQAEIKQAFEDFRAGRF